MKKNIFKISTIFTLTFISCFAFSQVNKEKQVVNLDGTWEIVFDHKNEGKENNWQNDSIFDNQLRKNIKVPSCWEEIEKDYEGVAFYRYKFKVPSDWNNKIIHLNFGAVNYLAEVWLNGDVVGFHEGGFTPFQFRVDKMIKPGETNLLILRVVGPIILSDKEVDGIKALETPQWRGGITGGIWQSVNLEATGDVHIDDVFIEPKIGNSSASLHISLNNSAIKGINAKVKIEIKEKNTTKNVIESIKSWKLNPGINDQTFSVTIPDAKLWSPDSPELYTANVKVIIEDLVSDLWSENFGMREFTIKDKDFYLNGQKIYVKATFFEGLYPNGIANPDSEEMARKEIQLAKEAGFNMIRPWRRPPNPNWLDLADEMGVLVVGSPVLECMTLPLSTPYLPARVENEIRESILRDRNRACIVQWELFNELHRPVLMQMMHSMAMVTRDLDPTRLILDESGGWAYGANMYLPYEFEPTKFNDIHTYPGPFINNDYFDGFLSIGLSKEDKKAAGYKGSTPGRNVVPGLMSFVSELGYGSLPNLEIVNEEFKKNGNLLTPAYRYHERLAKEQKELLKESGFANLYPDMEQFYIDQQSIHGAANKRMIEAVRANPKVDGYCIHALVAGDWILGAGLLDIWRNPKSKAYEDTKSANQPQIVTIRTFPRNVYANEGMSVQITGINELKSISAKMTLEIVDKEGKVVFNNSSNLNWETGVLNLFDKKIETTDWQGNYTVKVSIHGNDKSLLTKNSFEFTVFGENELIAPKSKVAVLNPKSSLAVFLKKKGLEVVEFTKKTDKSIPLFINGAKAKDENKNKLINKFITSGATAIYIEGIPATIEEPSLLYPFKAIVHPARGLWTCMPHLVHDHLLFKDLPSNMMMRETYENVWATKTLRDIVPVSKSNVETVVGVVAFDWFSKDHKMHYSGPGKSWWGSDIAIIPSGKGKCIVSQLSIIKNLGKDPVADKILFNMINYATKK